jgi:hypothetical protein
LFAGVSPFGGVAELASSRGELLLPHRDLTGMGSPSVTEERGNRGFRLAERFGALPG